MYKLIFSATLLIAAMGAPSPSRLQNAYEPQQHQPRPSYNEPQHEEPASFNFDWAVKDDYSGNNYGHQENRDGHTAEGSYYVLLPDGRTQTVTYRDDGHAGYVAEVTYEGEATYPEHQSSNQAQPSYQQRPTYQQPKLQPTYQQPKPQPTYQQPKPQPTYQQPKPQPTYQQPKPQPTYQQPTHQPTYQQPQSQYGF